MYLGELGPPPGKTRVTGGTCPSPAFSLEEVKLSTIFSLGGKNPPFRGVNLPLGEKALFLKEYFLNLLASFSLEAVNLLRGEMSLSTAISLGGMNRFPGSSSCLLGKVSFP